MFPNDSFLKQKYSKQVNTTPTRARNKVKTKKRSKMNMFLNDSFSNRNTAKKRILLQRVPKQAQNEDELENKNVSEL